MLCESVVVMYRHAMHCTALPYPLLLLTSYFQPAS